MGLGLLNVASLTRLADDLPAFDFIALLNPKRLRMGIHAHIIIGVAQEH
jgi:hypothetical protein